ncbi:hypothetical protein [Moorena producens]|uniref:hypothetical protein n=1 Tax=Moorena producens TaxID=1155739 RepID=UPI003C747DEF
MAKIISSNNVLQYLFEHDIYKESEIAQINTHHQSIINSNYLYITLSNQEQLIIKQDLFDDEYWFESKTINEFSLQSFLNDCHDLSFSCSLIIENLHFDESNSILIYKYSKAYTNLKDFYKDRQVFSTDISNLLGNTLATLHHETLNSLSCKDFMNRIARGEPQYKFPHPVHLLDKPTPESLRKDIPPEGFPFIALYQSSESLRDAVTELVFTHKHYCLTQNNLKLDNILISEDWREDLSIAKEPNDSIKIINWDKCSWGDPAFDLGTVISSYLLIWLNNLILEPGIKLSESLELANISLDVIQPSINSLLRSYLSSFPSILQEYPDFLNRVIQFTGLALIYEIVSMMQSFESFDYRCIHILQVAKKLLCQPTEAFDSILGISNIKLSNF